MWLNQRLGSINDDEDRKWEQWRAGYYFSGGGGCSGISTNMRPYIVTLDKRVSKARAERRRCEVSLGGSGGCPSENF